MLLVVEDLHWLDSETQALLDAPGRGLPTARILLLVNYRPEYTHGWGNKSHYTQLRIDPLGRRAPRSCSRRCWATTPPLEPLKPLLIERTEGNPFFLEESVRSLVETGALAGERGAYRLARAVESDPGAGDGPGGAGRPHRPPAAGGEAPAPDGRRDREGRAVRAAPGHRRDAGRRAAAALARLQAAELLYPVSLFPELEYTFKHALTHEVAYGSLLQERRKALHARIVDGDRAAVPGPAGRARRAAGPPRPARRALGAGGRLLPPGRASGRGSVGVSARRQRISSRRSTALEHLPETRDAAEQAIDLRLELRRRCVPLGDARADTRVLGKPRR